MKKIKILVASAIACLELMPVSVLAAPDFSTDYPDVTQAQCENPSSTPITNRCLYLEAKAADTALNDIYQQVKSKFSGQEEKQFINSELAWIKYRDAACDMFLATDERGVRIYYRASAGLYWTCITQITKQRVAVLSDWK